ncbi:hypothetical protein Bca4012_037263 [Brassica carinata]
MLNLHGKRLTPRETAVENVCVEKPALTDTSASSLKRISETIEDTFESAKQISAFPLFLLICFRAYFAFGFIKSQKIIGRDTNLIVCLSDLYLGTLSRCLMSRP